MSDDRYDYDPGTPYEPPPRRRKRDYKREGEYDDAWAAAEEAGDFYADADAEDFAAGYHWEDRDRYGVDGGDRTHPADWRDTTPLDPRATPLPGHTLRTSPPPTYHRDRARRGEFAEYYGTPVPPSRRAKPRIPAAPVTPGIPAGGIPYWQVLAIVVMSVLALLAVGFACAAILLL